MSNMRKLISLMEGVMAVPGINPELAEDDVMENMTDYDEHFIGSVIRDMYPASTSREELMSMVAGQTGYGSNPDFERVFDAQLDAFMGPADIRDQMSGGTEPTEIPDGEFDDVPFEEDLQNGYADIEMAQGEDFFPDGADSPVVTSVGPSGARQGDNPEQKMMQVAEVHKELVFGYRNFLKESAKSQKKKLTESALVSDVQMQDYHEYAHAKGNTVDFDGTLSMSARVQSKNGQPIDIGYSVDVTAKADIDWESDDYPSGWDYSRDEPTFTSSSNPIFGDILVTSVTFTPNGSFVVDNEETSLSVLQQHVDPHVLKQLLNPSLYVTELNPLFVKAIENLEPPEPDFNEPERDWD